MGIFSWYGVTIRTKVVIIQQKYEAITGVNYRVDTKGFTYTMQEIDIMPILRRCKKNNVKNPGVNSAIYQ